MRRIKGKRIIVIPLVAAISLGCFGSAAQMSGTEMAVNGIKYYISNDSDNLMRFSCLLECSNGLKDEGNGKLKCVGGTVVRDGYKARTVVELQQSTSNGWTTIKTWSGTGGSEKSFGEYYYVNDGTYRLKVTHIAIDGDEVTETFISYSSTVTVVI